MQTPQGPCILGLLCKFWTASVRGMRMASLLSEFCAVQGHQIYVSYARTK